MYVDACDNYSETELKNRASVCEQRQFDALWSGGQARQGCEQQPSVATRNIWMTVHEKVQYFGPLLWIWVVPGWVTGTAPAVQGKEMKNTLFIVL